MLYGLIRILSKIKWWVTKSKTIRQTCNGFCPMCEYYDYCVLDNTDEYWNEK